MSEQQPTPEPEKPGMTQSEFWKFIYYEARAQIYFLITGKDCTYDPEDPSVEEAFNKRVDQALEEGGFVDAQGRRQKIPGLVGGGLNPETALRLATEGMKRMVEQLKAGAK